MNLWAVDTIQRVSDGIKRYIMTIVDPNSKNLTYYWIYPRSPKMNAYNERFNRTIQEQIEYLLEKCPECHMLWTNT